MLGIESKRIKAEKINTVVNTGRTFLLNMYIYSLGLVLSDMLSGEDYKYKGCHGGHSPHYLDYAIML